MFRFVALLWARSDDGQSSAAQRLIQGMKSSGREWTTCFQAEGIAVLCSGTRAGSSEIYSLANGAGVILGKLFHTAAAQDTITRPVRLSAIESAQVLQSRGASLIRSFWGRYIGFVHDAGPGISWIVRDPTGGLPCYSLRTCGILVVFSDIQDVRHLQPNWSIDWGYIAARMTHSLLVRESTETGLEGVSRVMPGGCLEVLESGATSRSYWSSKRISQLDPIEDFAEATKSVARVTRSCLWAWASTYPRIIHLLSGGFDSSVVLSCLRRAPSAPSVTCVNYFDASRASDERAYARLVARRFDCELMETEEIASKTRLETMLNVKRFAVPWSYLYFVEHSRAQGELARQKGAQAIFSGAGGDQIFFQAPLALAVEDFLSRFGFGSRFVRYSLDVGRAKGTSVWSMAGRAMAGRIVRPRWTPLNDAGKYRTLVSAEVVDCVRHDAHQTEKWLRMAEGLPKGKFRHLLGMACSQDFYDPLGDEDYPERVRPLVSQPLIELCLRIPTFVLANRGWDRAAARQAFASALPPEIVQRRSKGAIDAYVGELLRHNLTFVREIMLDGVLVRERLLNRRKVESMLLDERAGLASGAGELLSSHLSTEVWARGWSAERRSAAG